MCTFTDHLIGLDTKLSSVVEPRFDFNITYYPINITFNIIVIIIVTWWRYDAL